MIAVPIILAYLTLGYFGARAFLMEEVPPDTAEYFFALMLFVFGPVGFIVGLIIFDRGPNYQYMYREIFYIPQPAWKREGGYKEPEWKKWVNKMMGIPND